MYRIFKWGLIHLTWKQTTNYTEIVSKAFTSRRRSAVRFSVDIWKWKDGLISTQAARNHIVPKLSSLISTSFLKNYIFILKLSNNLWSQPTKYFSMFPTVRGEKHKSCFVETNV